MVENKNVIKVPPDGGWGWFIVIGFAISTMISIPILQGFGLLFRETFEELNLSATDISTIINVNSGFGLMLGIMNGPLLKMFGYRKMAMCGSLLMFIGFILTSQAKKFYEFIIYYGIINSIGFSMTVASFGLATYTYFREKRAMAAGIGATLTGLGPVVMPLFISTCIDMYGARGTSLILSGLLLHSFAASLLLQPIKWHCKTIPDDSIKKEIHIISSPKIEDVEDVDLKGSGRRSFSSKNENNWRKNKIGSYEEQGVKNAEEKQRWYMKVVKFFDLDLLKDPIYRNIWIGMSLAYTGEINFSLMTPIILGDRKFSIEQTARIMSVIATSDIVFRFLAPFIGSKVKLPARQMFMISLIMLMVTRFAFTFVYSYNDVLIVGAFLGIAKGFRTVYMYLVVPSYVPLEKLASASGLETVLNGILLLSFGPLVGFTRDYFGNYNVVIHLINVLTFLTISIWSLEMLTMSKKVKAELNQ